MQPIFKEKSNYSDFLHIRMARCPNLSGQVEFYCTSYCKFGNTVIKFTGTHF